MFNFKEAHMILLIICCSSFFIIILNILSILKKNNDFKYYVNIHIILRSVIGNFGFV